MFRKLLPGLSLIAVFAVAEADTLLIDGVEAEQATRSQRPNRGETKARVEERFGAPTRMVTAVGDPPISRWEYPSFIVYFEYDHVIHAVPRRQS
jgi:hypothetical protein